MSSGLRKIHNRIPIIASLVVPLLLVIAALVAAASTAAVSSTAPSVKHESVANISLHDATIQAQIDPGNLETTYYFQVGQPGTYRLLMTCPSSENVECELLRWGNHLPPRTLNAGSSYDTVTADITKEGGILQPGTIYHYRVVASNAVGTTYGPDRTFTTRR